MGYAALVTFLTFLVLKLTHVTDWSWVWVTAPAWGFAALFAVMSVLTYIQYRRLKKRAQATVAAILKGNDNVFASLFEDFK